MPETFGKYDELALLTGLKNGNQSAFAQLYDANKRIVYANTLRLVKSHEFAAELLQDVFLKVWQHRESIDLGKNFKAYLLRIAQNSVYDFFRKAAHQRNLLDSLMAVASREEPRNPIEERIYLKETETKIEDALGKLPDKCREVFLLCKMEGKSYHEVALLLNISTATINNHIVKANRILKEHLLLSTSTSILLFYLFN